MFRKYSIPTGNMSPATSFLPKEYCGRADDSCFFLSYDRGEVLPMLYRGRFLGSLAKRYVGHSSSACKSLGKGAAR